ncbi:MAG: transcription antitermination factor NusB [Lentisphaeria bacterium]|nr:transcription antitermination factor NusB [Lentisphaeria bacterium]
MTAGTTDGNEPRNERFRRERHFARRCALQFLYQADVRDDWTHVDADLKHLQTQIWDMDEEVPRGMRVERTWEYTERLVRGILLRRRELDETIAACATNWTLRRMSVIDRNILRLAAFELRYCGDVPPLTALDEGVELAKQFGHADSSRFVNGVLDRIHREHPHDPAATGAPDETATE